MPDLTIGDRVTIILDGTITRVSNSHGLCYEVEFPQRDYSEPRKLFVDPWELVHIALEDKK